MQKTNMPPTHRDWAEEALTAYELALGELHNGTAIVEDKINLFRVAPLMAAQNRGMDNVERTVDMLAVTTADIERDFEVDAEARTNCLFYFVFAYVHCHVHGDYLDEMEADRIMEFINDHYDLFGRA